MLLLHVISTLPLNKLVDSLQKIVLNICYCIRCWNINLNFNEISSLQTKPTLLPKKYFEQIPNTFVGNPREQNSSNFSTISKLTVSHHVHHFEKIPESIVI